MTYEQKTFSIPELTGLSKTSIDEHLKLYAGYVKHANLILEKLAETADESKSYERSELQRRFSFEYNGIRNHELYFSSLEGGAQKLSDDSPLLKAIEKDFGSFDAWKERFSTLAMTRGVGWAMMYYDTANNSLTLAWVEEQHWGHLIGLTPIFAIDMWEHSFVFDYQPSGKKKYIEDFFNDVNWSTIEKRYIEAKSDTK